MKVSSAAHDAAVTAFLGTAGWAGAERAFLAGDASFRHYERVTLNGRRAVLMDAPPDKEPLAPFVTVADYLLERGFSAPKMLARDAGQGFLLLEDFGDASFARILKDEPRRELELYKAAADFLIALQENGEEGATLPAYSTEKLLEEAALFTDWYLPEQIGKATANSARAGFLDAWRRLLADVPFLPNTVVLRDFHADNLMWLPERDGVNRVGLLDFQDALLGSPAYDLVSILEDARRDVTPETAQMVLNHYLQRSAWGRDAFLAVYSLLGAQRNSKIIGIFTRLAARDGKPHYLSLIPRVWRHLENDLRHPMLKPLQQWFDSVIPPERRGAPVIEPRKAG